MNLHDRKDFLKQKQMCFGCYAHSHISKGCLQRHKCKTCGRRHPTALHDPNYDTNRSHTNQSQQQTESSGQIHIQTASEIV
jgi:hypothetical protein